MQLSKFKNNISGPIIGTFDTASGYESLEAKTILLIDDEPTVTDICELMLKELGHNVLKAHSGSEGISLYEAYRNRIDLIISDFNMPSMNGQEVVDNLRIRGHRVKVLLCTGGINVEDDKSAVSKGFTGLLRKPFSLKALSQKIAESLN